MGARATVDSAHAFACKRRAATAIGPASVLIPGRFSGGGLELLQAIAEKLLEFTSKEYLLELLPSMVIEPDEKKCQERQIRLKQIFNR